MKYLITVILAFLFVLPAQAQSTSEGETISAFTRSGRIPTINTRKVEGSPFLYNKWQNGYVLLKHGKKSSHLLLKYDTKNNRLYFKRNNKILVAIPSSITGFVLLNGSQKMVFKKGFKSSQGDISRDQLFQLIYDGKVKLLEKHYTIFHEDNGPALFTGKSPDKYITKHKYYLITQNGTFHAVKLKQNDILDALSSHQNELKAYAKSTDLKFDHPQGLKKILQKYDQLIERAQK